MITLESRIIPTWGGFHISRFLMISFDIGGEISIHYRHFSGFFLVCFRQRNALGDGAARGSRRMDHGYRQLVMLYHNFGACSHASQKRTKLLAASISEMWMTGLAMT
ncbi:MAG TPA: hypothetical protein VFQ41_07640 [Candidatus Angelobacter sp.]|nr:hypothetical protein [Candidatus Angelobacter sp.]